MATKLPSGLLEIPYVRQSGNDGRTEHINLTDNISDTITLSKSSNKNSFYYFDKEEDTVQLDHSLKKSNIAITSSRIGSYIYLLDGTSTSILKNYSSFEKYCPTYPHSPCANARSLLPFIRKPERISETNVLLALENTNATANDLASQITGASSNKLYGWRNWTAGILWDTHGGPITTLLIEGSKSKKNQTANDEHSDNSDLITIPSKFRVKNIDKITNFNPSTDTLEIDTDSFGVDSSANFATAKNKRKLKKLAKKDFDFLYDQKKGGLYFNENGANKGFGDGGIIAILKGAPNLTSGSLEFI
tara:strand:- start:3 stop:914 length:912 start_codon:yes stop_codon:yes gene_type:complete